MRVLIRPDSTHHYIEAVYEAEVDAVEEAILNALVAAETAPLIKPFRQRMESYAPRLPERIILTAYNR